MDETPATEPVEATLPEEAAAAEPEPIPAATPEQVEKAENLIRQANLAKVRGQGSVAERLLQEAAKVAPGSSMVLETIGDSMVERRQTKKAMEAYKQAFKIDPNNVSAERKYAELILRGAAAASALTPGNADAGTMASYKVAAILSILVPGLGQLVTAQYARGAVMMGGSFLGWAAAFALDPALKKVISLLSTRPQSPNLLVFAALFMAAAFHLWSMFDAAASAKRWTPKHIDRPVPPSDRDFEI